MKYLLTLLLFILISLSGMSQFVRLNSASVSKIEGFVNSQMNSEEMVGLSVGIIVNGEVVYLKGFGLEDKENNINASEHTMYRLASVSKTVTGLMSMRLLEKGRLDLDKDIRDYVPEYPVKPEGTITSEDLLSNESGIIHYSGTASGQYCSESYNSTFRDNYIANHTDDYDPVEAIGIFKDQKICFTPGDHYQYTTWGFCLMGAVLERAGGMSFDSLLHEEVVCPLNLPSLQIEYQNKRPFPNEAKGYEFDGSGNVIPTPTGLTDYTDISYKVPGGGMISSVEDLTLLIQGVVNRTLISDSTVKIFGKRHVPGDSVMSFYGYGTSTNFRNGDTLFWHSGSQAKTATLIYYSPENKNGLALMCNTRGVGLFPLARLIYDYLPSAVVEGDAYSGPTQNDRCPTSGLPANISTNNRLLIYPNPAKNSITVEGISKDVEFRILDVMGRNLNSGRLSINQNRIDVSELTAGIYLLQLGNRIERIVIE